MQSAPALLALLCSILTAIGPAADPTAAKGSGAKPAQPITEPQPGPFSWGKATASEKVEYGIALRDATKKTYKLKEPISFILKVRNSTENLVEGSYSTEGSFYPPHGGGCPG